MNWCGRARNRCHQRNPVLRATSSRCAAYVVLMFTVMTDASMAAFAEFGIELIKFLIQKYMGLERQYSRQVKYRKYFSLQICMPIPKRKVFLSTDAKIRIILTFADRFHSYFGKMFVILTIINVIS